MRAGHRILAALALAAGAWIQALVAAEQAEARKIIAVYGDAVKLKNPPPGWSFLWNAHGPIGQAANYVPLRFDDKLGMYCVTDESGKVNPNLPRSNLPGRPKAQDSNGVARFFVTAYTLQNDSAGDVWIQNGNIAHRLGGQGDGLQLMIYLNDEEKFSAAVTRQRAPLLFQQNLGKLKKGDGVYVMVGPGEKSAGYFGMQYCIEEWPAGGQPGPAVNILSPPITASTPPHGADGECSKGYLERHKSFCEAALTNKPELVFIGDSITDGWPRQLLDEKFGKYKPAEFGISGDWVQGLRWRVENGMFDRFNPRVIVVLIGINNLSNGFTPEEVAEGTGLLVKALREKSPPSKILLLGIFPRGTTVKPPACEEIRQVNAKTVLLADNQAVFFLDIGDKLVEPDGSIKKEVFPDGLHPGREGYLRWADAVLPTIEKFFAK